MNIQIEPLEISAAAPDPISEKSVPGRLTYSAVAALAARQGVYQIVGGLVGIFLARQLSASEFGVYAISNFLFFLFLGLGDLGLGASVLRQKKSPDIEELRLVLAVRQAVDLVVFSIVWIFSAKLAELYALPSESIWLFRSVALASLITSFQVVPTVLLERNLRFVVLAAIEVAQVIAQAAVLVVLILSGGGIQSFGYSLLVYAAVGATLSNMVSPWQIGWNFNFHEIKSRLPFSLPFQGVGLLSLAKDGITPILVGMLIGTAGAGRLNLAQMVAAFPLLPLLILQRAFFPAFSKIRHDQNGLRLAVEQGVFLCNCLAAPLAVLFSVLAQPLVLIVFGEKWSSVVPLISPLMTAALFIPTSIPLLSYFYANGRSSIPFLFSLFTTLGMWGLGTPLLLNWGIEGFVLVPSIVSFGVLGLVVKVRSELGCNFSAGIAAPWAAALLAGAAVYFIGKLFVVENLIGLAIFGFGGTVSYLVFLIVFVKLFFSSGSLSAKVKRSER